jgi:predicted transcriptional regulator
MNALIGICDDPRYFSHPERYDAGIIWFAHGEIEYLLPSFIFDKPATIKSLEISLEICSEAPGFNENFLSDIYFDLNGVSLGKWLSPGDFGNQKGIYTPKWWYLTEYGKLVTIKITTNGTYVNDQRVSDVTLEKLNLSTEFDAKLKISSPLNTTNPGGINIFGKGFGNYDQGIMVKIFR